MASAVGFEDSGLPVEEAVGDQESFHEFTDIQRALAQESGQEVPEATGDIEQEEIQIDSLIENGIDSADLEAQRAGQLGEELSDEPKKQKGSRADKRIQSLIKEKKTEAARMQGEMQQRDQYYRTQMAEMQQQLAQQQHGDSRAMQEQLELQRQQFQYLQETGNRKELTPVEQYELDLINKASKTAGEQVLPEVQALKQKLEAMEQASQQREADSQRQQRFNHYNQQTRAVRDGVLLKDFAPDRAKQLAEPMDEMLLAFCGAFGVEPNVAGPQFKKYLDLYVQGSLENRARGGGQTIRKGRDVLKSAPGGKRTASSGNKFPEYGVLKKNGYSNFLEWMSAGEPIIS